MPDDKWMGVRVDRWGTGGLGSEGQGGQEETGG